MELSFLSGAGRRRSAKFFDIRLDDEYIVFRGDAENAASAHLRGKLVLCLAEPLAIKHLRLTLTGVSNCETNTFVRAKRKFLEEKFFEKVWTFREARKGKIETLNADNYEHPFDVVLEGSMPESIEGMASSWVIYRFKAEIGRRYARDIVIRKPLRIIRTFDSTTLELAHAMTVSNIWPDKLEYSISTPSKAVIYGTAIQVEFRLVSLLKGLKFGIITTQVIENQEYDPDPNTVDSPMNGRKLFRVVAQDVYTVPEEPDILDEQVEGYKFSRQIQLPKKLTKCLQDANTRGIKIRHKLKFNVLLHNPDKHTSELRATLPVALYISPSLAINEDNEVVDQTPVAARRAMQTDLAHQTPPLYGDHQLDQLYSEVDFSGYRTPGNVSTPGTPFGSHSRNISSENLFALDEASGGSSAPAANGTGPGDVSAAALRSRLQNLRSGPTPLANECNPNDQDTSPDVARRTSATNGSRHGDYFSSETSSRRSRSRSSANGSRSVTPGPDRSSIGSGTNLSRRTSDEDDYLLPSGAQTPEPRFYEIEYLSRVPSYATAVRAPAHQPYSGSDLPSYGDATSRNGSLSSSPNAGLEPPPTAHLRGQIAGAVESLRGESTLSARDLRLPGRSGPLGRTVGEIQDEDRRFRLMQARGRS